MGLSKYDEILKNIGKYKASGKSCMQIKKLDDIDRSILKELIQVSVEDLRKVYPNK